MFFVSVILEAIICISFWFSSIAVGTKILLAVIAFIDSVIYIAFWGKGNIIKTVLKILHLVINAGILWYAVALENWVAAACGIAVIVFIVYLFVDEIISAFPRK